MSQFIDDATRGALGYQRADPTLTTAADIFMRVGYVPHFDLRIRADSLVGRAIVYSFDVKPRLSNADGEAKILKGLRNEMASRTETTQEEVRKLALQFEREEKA